MSASKLVSSHAEDVDAKIEVKEHRKKRDKAWGKHCGEKVGVEVWRIEDNGVRKWSKNLHGLFYKSDSYICLKTSLEGGKKKHEAHFWLGETTERAEMELAATKINELDDICGEYLVQHRQVQGHETPEFLNLFKFMHYLEGGVDGTFDPDHPENFEARLVHFKGSSHKHHKMVRMHEVPMTHTSLNMGDVFLLDTGLHLMQWHGTHASGRERNKAREMILEIRMGRRNRPKHEIIDGLEDHDIFWELLGGKPDKIADPIPDDAPPPKIHRLWRVADEEETEGVTSKLTAEGKAVSPSLLGTEAMAGFEDDVWILETNSRLWIYVGRGASETERAKVMGIGTLFVAKHGLPLHLPFTRLVDEEGSSEKMEALLSGKIARGKKTKRKNTLT